METIIKELKKILKFWDISEENIYTVESWLLDEIAEKKQEVQDYLDSL